MAGARTLVSVLWQVSDKNAARFAGSLYEKQSLAIPLRMRDLQLKILEDLRAEGRPDHSYSWAAFIAQGATQF
jgi:CHAT domain-containing protein